MNYKIPLIGFLSYFAMVSISGAQTKSNAWEGAYGQVAIGYESYIPKATAATTTTTPHGTVLPTYSTATHANGPTGSFGAGYNFGINDTLLLGIGVALSPGGSSSATSTASNAGGTAKGVYNVTNAYSISLIPGYAIDSSRLLYVKLGYAAATTHASAFENAAAVNYPQQSVKVNGTLYGLGYKQMVTDAIYLLGEANYAVNREKQVSVLTNGGYLINSPSNAVGFDLVVGIGYRF
jgi:opacity protein-like surface antigen